MGASLSGGAFRDPTQGGRGERGREPTYDWRVLLVAPILLVAVLIGYAVGGRLHRLADAHVRLWPVAIAALLLQVIPLPEASGRLGELLPPAALLLSFGLLMVVCVANWRLAGFLLILAGFGLNFVVVAANRGMPVAEETLRASGQEEAIEDLRGASGKHHLATEEDVLRPLGDVIGVPPPVAAAVSIGDLIAWVGAGVFVVSAMRGRPARRPSPRHRRQEEASMREMWR